MTTTPASAAYLLVCKYAAQLRAGSTNPASVGVADALALLRSRPRPSRQDLELLAAVAIADWARSAIRSHNRAVEDLAVRAAEASEDKYLGKYKHGSMDKQRGAGPMGCPCERCERARETETKYQGLLWASLTDITAKYAAELRIEWSAELLATPFAVDQTGETVTWGEATVEQHERRIAMLEHNAAANIETAARHRAAVERLHQVSALSLNEAVAVAGR